MSAEALSGRTPPDAIGPWQATANTENEIRMIAPRSTLPIQGKYLLWAAGVAAALVSLRFVLIGAWPVLLFSVLDIGGLAVALYLFSKGPVPEERLRVAGGIVELVRLDGRGRQSRIALPAYWTRIEASGRTELDHALWLVFRRERYPIGQCVSAAERRALEPRIRALLQTARGAA
ncbi:DUF2244 domain-containing protein [Sphingomonas pokkalii]|uniref:DUF2244 domain-containing protein n=1 Tax=Sphingomonas pokkalii TaxID=2175090 RepID=A0A2U0SCJ4_9SPHN|nr:DUF2244 domain-containing protein [Sphingomonas pokkalii]PVX29011.1 hypothetical protein DD559_06405 [Sphingomonas pokkalii]